MRRPVSHAWAGWVAAAAVIAVAVAVPEAQRRGGRNNAAQGLPVATNTILADPDAYYGKVVTLSAGVDQMLSKTTFVVDQWKMTGPTAVAPVGKPILVVAPYLTASLDRRSYLMMRGPVVKFDPIEIARAGDGYILDMTADVRAKYTGQPVLVATSILNSVSLELARKPLMPEEISLTSAMKTIAPAFASLRTAAQESKADVVSQNVARLLPAFSQTEAIWDGLGQSPAAQWARDAREHAVAIDKAAAAGDWAAVNASAGALNQVCGSCHNTYRERQDDGLFRFKAGSF